MRTMRGRREHPSRRRHCVDLRCLRRPHRNTSDLQARPRRQDDLHPISSARSFLSCAVKRAVTTTTPSMTVDGEERYFLILILASLGVHLMLAPWTAFLIRL